MMIKNNKFDRDSLNTHINNIITTAFKQKKYYVDLPVRALAELNGYTGYKQEERLCSNLVRDLRKAGYRSNNHKSFIRVFTE